MAVDGKYASRMKRGVGKFHVGKACLIATKDVAIIGGIDPCNSVSYCDTTKADNTTSDTNDMGKLGRCRLHGWMIAIIVLIVLIVIGITLAVVMKVLKVTCFK